MKRAAVAFLMLVIVCAAAACRPRRAEESREIVFDKQVVRVLRQKSGPVPLTVEIADTNAKRERGLMYRTQIGEGEGMLFLFPKARVMTMWMANTPVSLDMLFIAKNGKIDEIAEAAVPFSRDVIYSSRKVSGVLELKAGAAERLGIKVGDTVEHSFFKLENQTATR